MGNLYRQLPFCNMYRQDAPRHNYLCTKKDTLEVEMETDEQEVGMEKEEVKEKEEGEILYWGLLLCTRLVVCICTNIADSEEKMRNNDHVRLH